MKRKLIEVELKDDLIVCDNPKCEYTIKAESKELFQDISMWINVPCPNCGENLLTVQDYKDSLKLERTIKFLNKWFSWLTIFYRKDATRTTHSVHVHNGFNIKNEDKNTQQ